jgi:hypothetical protein
VAVANVMIMFLSTIVFVVAWCLDRGDTISVDSPPAFVCSHRLWSIMYGALLIIVYIFMISSMYVESWVQHDDEIDRIVGSLGY